MASLGHSIRRFSVFIPVQQNDIRDTVLQDLILDGRICTAGSSGLSPLEWPRPWLSRWSPAIHRRKGRPKARSQSPLQTYRPKWKVRLATSSPAPSTCEILAIRSCPLTILLATFEVGEHFDTPLDMERDNCLGGRCIRLE